MSLRNEYLKFCTFVEYTNDAHFLNFNMEEDQDKMTLIDTEFFPILIGAQKKIAPTKNFVSWYAKVAGRYIQERWMSNKRRRHMRQSVKPAYEF